MVATDKILFIMGNGPSLGEIMNDPKKLQILRDNHTFGLNAAYRAYEKYNFYPTYFGCFDYVVNESHKETFEKLVLSNNSIQEFYFIGNKKEKQNLYSDTVKNNDKFKKFNFIPTDPWKCNGLSNSYEEFVNFGCSGANATQIGMMKGYKKIVLLGCDCNYVNKIEQEKSLEVGKQIEIVKDIKTNVNYWFNNYQVIGDKLNTPDAEIWHIPAWENVKKFCPQNVEIINCSEISKINFFDKLNIVKTLNKLHHNDIISKYTFIIKTFNRYDNLINLVNSIKKYYNGVKLIIFDDSTNKKDINKLITYENKKIIDKYVNVGLSAGRNIMIENVETPLFLLLDDDFLLDDNCNLGVSYEIIKQGFDIVGGEVYDFGPSSAKSNQPRDFLGLLEKKGNDLYLHVHKNKGYHNNHPLYDFILNFFVGKTESFKNNKWDDNLKLGEHLDFFIRIDKSLKITYTNDFQIKHYQDTISNVEYTNYRNTVYDYIKIFKKKHNIQQIITVRNNNCTKING